MTRIIGGQGKGRRLSAPRGLQTRPTGARVRQTLFDILAPRIQGARFLDAFAGSGGVGLEALSRGAASVVLIETQRAALLAIEENVRLLRAAAAVQVLRQDARTAARSLAERGHRFDVVFLDPPYDSDLYVPLLELAASTSLLAEEGVVVAEHFHKVELPERIGRLARFRVVRVGDHRLSFFALKGEPETRAAGFTPEEDSR